ncbi:MAG: PilW family protein [Gammaproteobacteria bacterium]
MGFSITELLLSATLVMLLSAASLSLLMHTRQTQSQIENMADLEERAGFVLALLEDDIRLAGFWGLHADGSKLLTHESVSIRCGGSDITDWALQTTKAIEVTHNSYFLPCPPHSSAAGSADTLTLRHASPAITEARNGTVQVEATLNGGEIFMDGSPTDLATITQIHDVLVHAWYVDQASSEQGLPGLRRYTLTHKGLLQNQEIMPGIDSLTVRLGIDEDDDGRTDTFVTQNDLRGHPVLSLKVSLSVRNRLKVERIIALKNQTTA